MRTQTSQKAEPFACAPMKLILGVFATFLCALIFFSVSSPVSAATNANLNFQARLESNTGAIAPDGTYNIRFKLYNVSSGGVALWTETYQNSAAQGVTVTNGYVSVNLGSLTAFPGTINWDQNLYLTMDIAGTSASATPTYDGEMTPRLQLTSVPYAFRAGSLATYNGASTYTSTLSILAPTGGNQTFQIPDQTAAGTYSLLTTNTANANYIQNTTSTQVANFSVQSANSANAVGVIRGASGQTGNLLEFWPSSGGMLSYFNANGTLNFVGGGAVASIVVNSTSGTGVGSISIAATSGYFQKNVGSPGDNAFVSSPPSSTAILTTRDGGMILQGTSYWNGATSVTEYLNMQPVRNSATPGDYYLKLLGSEKIMPQYSGTVGLIVQGASSQSVDLLQVTNSSGTVLSKFDPAGNLVVSATGNSSIAGSLGVGVTGPAAKLDVSSSTSYAQLRLQSTVSGGSQALWEGAVADTVGSFIGSNSYYSSNFQFNPNYTAASGINFRQDGSTEFWNDTGLTSGTLYTPTKRLVISNTGNVGIGTVTPAAKLEISNGNLQVTYGNLNLVPQAAPAAAPTVAVNVTAGTLTGNYYYTVAFVTGQGTTNYGPISAVVAPSSQQVNLSAIPTGTSGVVTGRNIYRTTTGGSTSGPFYLVTTINDNTTTTYTDNLSDGSLGAAGSTLNQAGGIILQGGNALLASTGGNLALGLVALQANSTGFSNVAIGQGTLRNNTTGNNNSAIGVNALTSNTSGSFNTALGVSALYSNTSAQQNTAIGTQALYYNTTGASNSALGTSALYSNTTGASNAALGTSALYANTTGYQNSAFGVNALYSNSTGYSNIASGYNSLQNNTTGYGNIASGYTSLGANTSGYGNTASGYASLGYNSTGYQNTTLGMFSLRANTTGFNNTAIGFQAGNTDSGNNFNTLATLQNATAIGAFAQVQANNSIVLGSVDTLTNIGIGITVPSNMFSVSPIDYQTGTATRTNSSATLVGTGTTWTAAMVGEIIVFADGTTKMVSAFTDATHITMNTTFTGTTDASPVYYRFHKAGFQVTSGGNVGIANIAPGYALDVSGNVNSTTGYRYNGTSGATTTCSGGNVMQNTVVQGGIITGGSCAVAGTGLYVSLQASTPGVADTGNFNITGTGIAGILQAASFDRASAGALNIGATNATSIALGKAGVSTTVNANLSVLGTGQIGGTPAQVGELSILNTVATQRVLTLQAAVGQTSAYDILDLYNSGGSFVSGYDINGNLFLNGALQSGTGTAAGQLRVRDGSTSFKATLTVQAALGADRTINLPDEAGTLCIRNSANCGFAAGTAASYIQNQNTAQQATSNFWISGTGRADTSLQTPLLDTATGVTLSVGTTNATLIALNQNVTIATNKTLSAQGVASFQDATNSTNAFQIQNASGAALFTADTITRKVTITSGSTNAAYAAPVIDTDNTIADFPTANWTSTGWTTGAAFATHTTGNTNALTSTWTPSIGTTYEIAYAYSSCASANTLGVTVGGVTLESTTSCPAGITRNFFTATATTALKFTPSSTFTGTVQSVYVRALTTAIGPALAVVNSSATTTLEVRAGGSVSNVLIGVSSGQYLDTGTNLVALGSYALQDNSIGHDNAAIGTYALQINTSGNYNAALGAYALQSNTSGSNNTATGYYALQANTNGGSNAAFGYNVLKTATTASGNAGFGAYALQATTTGANNVAVGYSSLQANTTGNDNAALGANALYLNATGVQNVALGSSSLRNNTTGSFNDAIGYQSLYNNTTGTSNNAFGNTALYNNTTGGNNAAFGNQALNRNTGGSNNSATGNAALYYNSTGNYNTAIGYQSLYNNTTGSDNIAIGDLAVNGITGNNNIGIGYAALAYPASGTNNVALGSSAGYCESNLHFCTIDALQNATAIGAYTQVLASNSIVLGSVDTLTKIGIGTTNPTNMFSVSPLDYQTGTATRTNSSATLVGTGTTWTAAMVGDSIIFADGTTKTVSAFTDAAHITMSTTFTGTTDASPVYYRFHKVGFQVTSAGNAYLQNTSTTAFQVQNAAGTAFLTADTTNLNLTVNGNAVFKPVTDSLTAFQIQKSDASVIFNVDSTNKRVGINTATPGYNLDVNGSVRLGGQALNGIFSILTTSSRPILVVDSTATNQLNLQTTAAATAGAQTHNAMALQFTGNYWNGSASVNQSFNITQVSATSGILSRLAFQNNAGTEIATFNDDGSVVHKTSTNTATAFQIQNATAGVLLTADTSAMQVVVGSTTNGVILSANGIQLKGTARNTVKINLSAVYAGAVLDASNDSGGANCATNNNGTMSNGYDLTNRANYYKWTTAQVANQCTDIVVQVLVPTNFSAWAANPVAVTGYTTSTANGLINLEVRDTGGTADTGCNYVNVTPGAASTWSTNTTTCQLTGGTYTAGGYMTVRVRLTSPTGGDTRASNITFSYLSSF